MLISSWAGTKIVRKQGGYPETEQDGTVVCDNRVLNAYQSVWFEDDLTGVGIPAEYYYRAFPYNDQGLCSRNDKNRFEDYIVYGFRINKNDSNPATRVEYLESAIGMTLAHMDYQNGVFDYGDWAGAWFVEENKPYMVNYDGTPAYELDPDDYTKKLDGTASDIANSSFNGNAMAKIPVVWLKQFEDIYFEYCYISNGQVDEGYRAYAHTRACLKIHLRHLHAPLRGIFAPNSVSVAHYASLIRDKSPTKCDAQLTESNFQTRSRADGSVMDYKQLRIFKGSIFDGKLRSLSGQQPTHDNQAPAEIGAATANGSLWYTTSWADRNLIDMLLRLMSCNDNSQVAFGNGNLNYNANGSPTYGVIKTGSLNTSGQFFGYNDNVHDVKVFHLEGWWANQWERIAGMVYGTDGKVKVKMTPPYNTDGAGYTDTGITITGTNGGYASKTRMIENGRIPYEVSGSETTYTSDGIWHNTKQFNYALAGGDCGDGLRCGASCLSVNSLVSYSSWYVGAALSCEQTAVA